jgi:hypothetical protein
MDDLINYMSGMTLQIETDLRSEMLEEFQMIYGSSLYPEQIEELANLAYADATKESDVLMSSGGGRRDVMYIRSRLSDLKKLARKNGDKRKAANIDDLINEMNKFGI